MRTRSLVFPLDLLVHTYPSHFQAQLTADPGMPLWGFPTEGAAVLVGAVPPGNLLTTKNTCGRTRFQVPPQTGPFHGCVADPEWGYLSTPGMEEEGDGAAGRLRRLRGGSQRMV